MDARAGRRASWRTSPGPGWGGSAGCVFSIIVVATVLLLRNMNKRIKRLPETFEESTEDAPNTDPLKHLPPKRASATGEASARRDDRRPRRDEAVVAGQRTASGVVLLGQEQQLHLLGRARSGQQVALADA